jgi:hypothetical protein
MELRRWVITHQVNRTGGHASLRRRVPCQKLVTHAVTLGSGTTM